MFRNLRTHPAANLLRERVDYLRWRLGAPRDTPPPLFKQRLVKAYAARFESKAFVETGTYYGDMLAACYRTFEALYSIELNEHLYLRAQQRFARHPKITLIPGDSAVLLATVLDAVNQPCLIWLDAHAVHGYRDEDHAITPIQRELEQVLESDLRDYVLLIDDARLFGHARDYPTLAQIRKSILHRHPNWMFEADDDVIRAHSRR